MKPVLLKFSYDVQTIKKNKYVLSKSMELKKAKWNVFENGSIREGYYYANTARKRNERIISKTISGAIYFPTAPFCAMDKIFICIFSQSEDW